MVFSQYRETYEVLRDDLKLEGGNINDYAKMAIRNLLHATSCVHSRRLIAEFPDDEIKCIQKLQSHCANMTFSDKVDMTGPSNRLHIKEGNLPSITSKGFIMHRHCQFQLEIATQRTKKCTLF